MNKYIMSFLNQSSDLGTFAEVVPGSASYGKPEASSILTSRRRVRVVPQSGPTVGPLGQIQWLIADQGGLLDLRSVVINYTVSVAGASSSPCMDDGHPFTTVQALLNGQLLENIQNAAKLANVEMTMGGSKGYYQTAGSMQGWELLNDDLDTPVPTGSYIQTTINSYGYVVGNTASINARQARAAQPVWNGIAGEQRSIPLGLMCGLGRMNTYLPISLVGELALTLQTGSNAEMLFTTTSATDGTYTLSNLSLEYDIVTPDARYFNILKKMATDEGAGLVMPYESSIVATGAPIAASTSLTENTVIVSRATNNLLRSNVVFIPSSGLTSMGFPSQSCFGHAGTVSCQWRIGSLVYPQVAAAGDASIYNMSLSAYGSVMQENGSVANRVLWGNSTSAATAGTAAVFETAELHTGGTTKFCYADKFVPSYGFQIVKGGVEQLAIDGVSVSGSSGSQVIFSAVQAPGQAYTPYVVLTALKFIVAKGGAVSVSGA